MSCYHLVKRIIDVFLSFLGMIVSSPFWIIAIIGIELSDPGPFFYMANRVGKGNKTFKMFKFRSMYQGKSNESVFRGEEDRVFPFGKFIRTVKIDELPQLINIFIGDMSIVGPRPAAVDQMKITRGGKYIAAGNVQSGLTGPSALYDYIYGDYVTNEEEYREKVLPTRLELDLVYLKKMNLLFDLRIVWWTVVCIISSIFKRVPRHILATLNQWAEENK